MLPRSTSLRFAALLCAILAFAIPQLALGQEAATSVSFASPGKEAIPVNVLVGQSKVITFDHALERFSISNPDIAEAVLVAADQVLVNGKAFGQVNFIAWEKGTSKFVVFDVFVRTNLSLIDSQIHALFPKDDIRLSQANGSVVLSGTVSDPKIAAQADNIVQAAGFKTVNMLESPIKNATQIQLQVRVAEVSRNKLKEFGTAYQSVNNGTSVFASGGGPASLQTATNGALQSSLSALNLFIFNNGVGTQAFIRALQTQGALRALAEPNLIAMDGQTASFLAGGEFPIPIVQAGGGGSNAVTVEFKEYGVRLSFKPTILDEDHIRLELEPEVSTIDFANGVRFNGFVIPALRTRRAKTGLELRDGQSFALAGLLDNNETRSISKIPVLGDIPVLGELFKSKQFQKQETELMFIVTAQVVKPVNGDDLPQMHGIDGLKSGSPLGIEPKGDGIDGQTGYSVGDATKKSAAPLPAATPAETKPPAPVNKKTDISAVPGPAQPAKTGTDQ
jgi:pilus assembly protein CpaC